MPLNLGTAFDGTPVRLTDRDRSTHVHVVGRSDSGKSMLLQHMIRQDILTGRGLCLIDPHGTLADQVLEWCSSRALPGRRKVHILNPSDRSFTVGFNPLRLDGSVEPSVRVDAMVEACSQVWGGEDTNRTPLLKKCLRAVFYTLAVRDLTLVESLELIGSTDLKLIRRRLTGNLPDYAFAALWEEFNQLSRSDFAEQFSSTNNRLHEFLDSPTLRRIVGQTTSTLDLRSIMDRGEILIVNLALKNKLSAANARVLGSLLTSEFFLSAVGRDPDISRRRPFSLYIDECYNYLSGTVSNILDQTRKFGLHAVLAHQRIGQLRARSDDIYNGVMAGAQTKIVLTLSEEDDADIMARHLFRSSINLERPKHILDKPTTVGEELVWLEGSSTTDTETTHESYGASSNQTSGTSEGLTDFFGADGADFGTPVSESSAKGTNTSDGSGLTHSRGSSSGYSHTESRIPAFRPIRHVLPTAVYSLEEELHRAIVTVRELPPRTAVMKRPSERSVMFRTAEVTRPLTTRARTDAFVARAHTDSDYLKPVAQADQEIEERRRALRNLTPQHTEPDFWK